MTPEIGGLVVQSLHSKTWKADHSERWVIAISDDDEPYLIRRREARQLAYFVVASQDSLADWLEGRTLTADLACEYACGINAGLDRLYRKEGRHG